MVKLLVLLRHGESTWNDENKFTGWTDVPLSEKGKIEAIEAGKDLKQRNIKVDVVFTSILKRAILTSWSVLDNAELHYVPIINSWRLNERHYGALQGLNKAETAAKHGEDQVKIWRRSYDIPPPALEPTSPRWEGCNDPKYDSIPKDCIPLTECLKDTVFRVLPFWFDAIAPALMSGKRVMVSAHGNSLRALVKHLDNMSEAEVLELNIPTASPLIYELDDNLRPIKKYYLLDEAALKKKLDAVANQGKAKA